MEKLLLSKAVKTNQITRDEAQEWLLYLKLYTDLFLKKNYPWYAKNGYFPIKAQKKNAADVDPKFVVNHHTGGTKTSPVIARFSTAKMASSNFVIERNGNIIYLVDIHNLSYHATVNTWLPIDVRRLLGLEGKWINEPGIETVGNGMKYLFQPEQFKALICLQRFLAAYFPSITELKSHRFFSPKSRSGDPGFLYFLPLIEHSVFNDIDLESPNCWLYHYEKDPIEFANKAKEWITNYGLEDEWKNKRQIEITENHILPGEQKIIVREKI